MRPEEVAHIVGVSPKTLRLWSLAGVIHANDVRLTPGHQRRYRQSAVAKLLRKPDVQTTSTARRK